MNYVFTFVAFFVVAGVAATGLSSEYISEHGGVSKQEVLVYSELSILDLKGSYVIREPEVGMVCRLGIVGRTGIIEHHGIEHHRDRVKAVGKQRERSKELGAQRPLATVLTPLKASRPAYLFYPASWCHLTDPC